MDITKFWQLIDTARESSDDGVSKQADLLVAALVQLPVEEILAYEVLIEDLMDRAYDAALWDAAYIIGCGCGDSSFQDFRAWLIAQGMEVYTTALSDPESLVDLIEIDEDAQEGSLLYVVIRAYEEKTGKELPMREFRFRRPKPDLKGSHWPGEDKDARFPKLAAKFGDCGHRLQDR